MTSPSTWVTSCAGRRSSRSSTTSLAGRQSCTPLGVATKGRGASIGEAIIASIRVVFDELLPKQRGIDGLRRFPPQRCLRREAGGSEQGQKLGSGPAGCPIVDELGLVSLSPEQREPIGRA